MPAVDQVFPVDTDQDREKDREHDDKHERIDKSVSKQKSPSASTKAKDLSHVPCKFFKVGACTAGPSCPFSHAAAEPGAQKEPCAWFVKGNCKFGHKCALAHILPGQSMSMDRKNKKAAQQANAATATTAGPGGNDKAAKEGKKSKRSAWGANSNNAGGQSNPLLTGGSTAPTRLLSSGATAPAPNRPPMHLKASLSPSAPAPPLKDTEFASFAALDEMEGVQLPAPPAQGRPQGQEAGTPTTSAKDGQAHAKSTPSPVPLPTSAPRHTNAMPPPDFGPIGSPPSVGRSQQQSSLNGGSLTPSVSPRGPSHLNGINLSTSPNATPGFLSSSPFSAPGTQSVFSNNSYAGRGMAASLGSGLAMTGGRRPWGDVDVSASPAKGGLPISVQRSSLLNGNMRGEYGIELEYEDYPGRGRTLTTRNDSAVDDGDMEDFIPGSLTDLLTPEERSRRMSRSGSVNPAASTLTAGAPANFAANSGNEPATGGRLGHRYSSSVPATSLLGDSNSIWSGTSVGPLPGSPSAHPTHRGTPSASFVSRLEGLGISGQVSDDMGLSVSMGSAGAASSLGMLSPSNASAAFLPGLHHNYLKSKSSQQVQAGLGGNGALRGMRGVSNPLAPTSSNNGKPLSNNYLTGMGNQGAPSSVANTSTLSQLPTYRGAPSPFDLTQPMHQSHSHSSRPIPAENKRGSNEELAGHLLSPNTRALQAHAPGQSLPQGLAAGYSRIHALPPLANLASPGTSGGFPPPNSSPGTARDWGTAATSPPPSAGIGANATAGATLGAVSGPGATLMPASGFGGGGMESMMSKLTYSAATTRGGGVGGSSSPAPPGLSRNTSGRYQPGLGVGGGTGGTGVSGGVPPGSGPSTSPLRPRDDDDELFAMDK